MADDQCVAIRDPNSNWDFCLSKIPAYLYNILFSITLTAHIAQAVIYRKGYSWVVAMGFYSAWFILILLAPLCINAYAYAYMVLGRMVYNFTPSARILHVKSWRSGLVFVLLDILAFLAQAAGASMASGNNITPAQIERRLHIYMGGVGLQQFFILIFVYLTYRFQKESQHDLPKVEQTPVLHLLYAVYAALALITIGIIFRIAKYSQGYTSGPSKHEAYQYVFDSTMMLFALVVFNIVHPGRVMPGKENDFPSRKERKAVGKKNVRGRAEAGRSRSLYKTARAGSPLEHQKPQEQSLNPTYPQIDASTVSYGYVTEYNNYARYDSERRSHSEVQGGSSVGRDTNPRGFMEGFKRA